MNIAEAAIRFKTVTLFITLLLIGGGLVSYDKLGRLEDPAFTIKDARIITYYPGATPKEVEQEVTEKLETAIQELAQLKRIKSESKPGLSIITATIKDKYDKNGLPQVWDELRRKVEQAQSQLPPGVLPSIVFDDFGDVFGVLIAIKGQGYSYHELKDYADFLKKKLLQVKDVAKIITWGEQQQQIFVEISRARMSHLGISQDQIYQALKSQNLVVPSGAVKVGKDYIQIRPSGGLDSVKEIGSLVLRGKGTARLLYLKDIATITRGYITPPTKHMRYNGEQAIVLGVSTITGGNVVKMGNAMAERLKELQTETPLGMELEYIYYQGSIVAESVNGFIINLIEAIVIVIVVLMIFMGLRSGLLIGTVLLLTVCATILLMNIYSINLQRISLGALIIALGMLVDNAIVVTEGMQVRIERGMDKIKAASEVVRQTMWPLLGATVIAIMAFAAIGLSQDSTGEYLRTLFQVILISLGLSWVIAITVTPLFCYLLLKPKNMAAKESSDPYQGWLFQLYKGLLTLCLRFRWITVSSVVGMLALAMYGFTLLEDSFFPDSTSKQFMIHYWLPQGTDIRTTSREMKTAEDYIRKQKGVTSVSAFVGEGAPRYMLVYSPETSNSAYGLLLVDVDDYRKINGLIAKLKSHFKNNYLNVNPKFEKIRLGPGGGFSLEARFSGAKANVLRELSDKTKSLLFSDGGAYSIRDDWRERVSVIRPQFATAQARRAGVTRTDVANALQTSFSGLQIGLYREQDDLIPIISRPPENERVSVDNIYNVQIWSPIAQGTLPLRQVIRDFSSGWEDSIIHRRNKIQTITSQAEPIVGNTSVLLARVKPLIEAIPLPIGYNLEWGGEFENSKDAQAGLAANMPPTLILMIMITVILFNGLRQPLIIWLTVPLAIIGVTVGLLITRESFGFMALLGFLSLVGMLIKNAIVLIDEIEIQIHSGKPPYEAVVFAAVSRMRPVSMAAITTILGMLPLLADVFFFAMAVTIMSGLAFATLLTLIIVPVFYVIFFNIKYQPASLSLGV